MESQKLIELLVLCVFYLFSSVNTASDQGKKLKLQNCEKVLGRQIGHCNEYTFFSSLFTLAYKGPTTAAGLNLIKEHEGFHSNFYTNSIIVSVRCNYFSH